MWPQNIIKLYAAPKPEARNFSENALYKEITVKFDMERDTRLTILETQYIKS